MSFCVGSDKFFLGPHKGRNVLRYVLIVMTIILIKRRRRRKKKKKLEAIPGKHSIDSLQKTAIFGTSHIIRKVLQCEA